nr:MAG TPA: hypothetical protein [Caudoviricetes sp.]
MDLQNLIYLLLALVWLSGLIWASVIAFRSRKTNDKTTLKTNKSLNVNIGKMNARKLTTTYIGKDKR